MGSMYLNSTSHDDGVIHLKAVDSIEIKEQSPNSMGCKPQPRCLILNPFDHNHSTYSIRCLTTD